MKFKRIFTINKKAFDSLSEGIRKVFEALNRDFEPFHKACSSKEILSNKD